MKRMEFSLVQRVGLTLALLLGMFVLVGAFTTWAVHGIQGLTRQTMDHDTVQLVRMAAIQEHLLKARRAEKDISIDLLMKMDRVAQRMAEWQRHSRHVADLLQLAIAAELDPRVRDSLQAAQALQERYASDVSAILQKIERHEILDQLVFEEEIQVPVQATLAAELKVGQAIEWNRETTQSGGEAIHSSVRRLIWLVALGLLLAVISALVLGTKLLVRIRLPLAQLTQAISRVHSGDLSHAVAVDSKDELGRMSLDFNAMLGSLQSMVQEVRYASDSIHAASAQIAGGNLDLSTRTEQAAAHLQQAAASLDALTTTVRQMAESAKHASQIASATAQSAQAGGALVAQAVQSMAGIQASSDRIAEITSVIDGIAFQTNILALNAAVEAARAGEQGRGFAVVAAEVRSLAQRSAAAAREIKILIDTSREEVSSGSNQVRDAGEAMGQIIQQVSQVHQMIEDITRQASVQSSDIAGVNQSMSHLDQMTQQNAALVEEAAAASASLREQADRMAEVMRRFVIDVPPRPLLLAA